MVAMKVNVNSNLNELRRQQIEAQNEMPRQARQPQGSTSENPAAVADISAQVASENRTASLDRPIDGQAAAQALRLQIQDQAPSAINAHSLQLDRVRALLG